MAKDTYYFSHDYNARNDEKIKRLVRKHKYIGYGLFWAIVEDLYNNDNSLPFDYEGIADDFRTDSELIKSIIHDFDLFVIEEKHFYSLSIKRRLEERNDKSSKAKKSAAARWDKPKVDANALPTQSEGNAIKKGKDIKDIKDIKEREKIDAPNFFYIGTELFRTPISSYLKSEHGETLNIWKMQNKEIQIEDVFKILDKDVGKAFGDYDHPFNYFKSMAKQLLEKKTRFEKPESSSLNFKLKSQK